MNPTFRAWLTALVAANITGAAQAIVMKIGMPETFHGGFVEVLKLAAVSAVFHGAMYLSKSPLPNTQPTENKQ